ncbi:MAG: RecBCD enzyme subunit RecD [Chlamydiae bacterium]|nr:RecBCD enzyme subunit RecD [Chlamydiota bacterium]
MRFGSKQEPLLKGYEPALAEGFASVDFHFARRICPEGREEHLLFLAYLLKSAREGHLCVSVGKSLSPSNSHEFTPLLLEGGNTLPDPLFEEFLVKKGDKIYLAQNAACEELFEKHWVRLKSSSPTIPLPHEALDFLTLQPEQREAIKQSAASSLSLICGGPGTGKTYTAGRLIEAFLPYLKRGVVVTAPTGKAAANLKKGLGAFAEKCLCTTLHSLLREDTIGADLILVDEGSMVDAHLMSRLFAAVKTGSRLVLLGDPDQLPPVEVGHFFADLALSHQPVSYLTHCLRAELQEIVEMGAAVKRGEVVPFAPLPSQKSLVDSLLPRLSEESFALLTPMRKGPYGADALNALLYAAHRKRGGKKIPILITRNDPSLNLFNGDTGFYFPEEKIACFGEKEIPHYLLPHYSYAYALSIHKSQGSEYDRVTILLPPGSEVFGREVLYTAITRAKSQVELFTDAKTLEALLGKRTFRLSGLSQ